MHVFSTHWHLFSQKVLIVSISFTPSSYCQPLGVLYDTFATGLVSLSPAYMLKPLCSVAQRLMLYVNVYEEKPVDDNSIYITINFGSLLIFKHTPTIKNELAISHKQHKNWYALQTYWCAGWSFYEH